MQINCRHGVITPVDVQLLIHHQEDGNRVDALTYVVP